MDYMHTAPHTTYKQNVSNQYYIQTSGPNIVYDNSAAFQNSVVVAVADSEMKRIYNLAVQCIQDSSNTTYKEQLVSAMIDWFYSTAITDSLWTGRLNIVQPLVKKLIEDIKTSIKQASKPTYHQNIYQIMKNITEVWAYQNADFEDFRRFVLRFVTSFMKTQGQQINKTQIDAFNLKITRKPNQYWSSQPFVQHLFWDKAVVWFMQGSLR
jgi:hypothetical protein